MKKIFKVLSFIIWPVILGLWFYIITSSYEINFGIDGSGYELAFYGLLCVVLFGYFSNFVVKIKKLWLQIMLGVGFSSFYTVVCFLVNNYWRYISFKHNLGEDVAIPYINMLKNDLIYTEGLGIFRYVILFLILFALCGLRIYTLQPKVNAFIRKAIGSVAEVFSPNVFNFEEITTEELTEADPKIIKAPRSFIAFDENHKMLKNEPYASFLKAYREAKEDLDNTQITIPITGKDKSFINGFYIDEDFYKDAEIKIRFNSTPAPNGRDEGMFVRVAYVFKAGEDNGDFHNRRIDEIKRRLPFYYIPNVRNLEFTAEYDNGYQFNFDAAVPNIELVPDVCCSLLSLLIAIFSLEN